MQILKLQKNNILIKLINLHELILIRHHQKNKMES